jgi:hypothetical protein
MTLVSDRVVNSRRLLQCNIHTQRIIYEVSRSVSMRSTYLYSITGSEMNPDLDAQQRTRLGEFILSAAIGFPRTKYVFSTTIDLGRANEK